MQAISRAPHSTPLGPALLDEHVSFIPGVIGTCTTVPVVQYYHTATTVQSTTTVNVQPKACAVYMHTLALQYLTDRLCTSVVVDKGLMAYHHE